MTCPNAACNTLGERACLHATLRARYHRSCCCRLRHLPAYLATASRARTATTSFVPVLQCSGQLGGHCLNQPAPSPGISAEMTYPNAACNMLGERACLHATLRARYHRSCCCQLRHLPAADCHTWARTATTSFAPTLVGTAPINLRRQPAPLQR